MERFMRGDIVIIPFPFSDLSRSKRRPALVAAALKENELILCQITSKAKFDEYAISITKSDFKNGSLLVQSFIRTNKLFTADTGIILYKAGALNQEKILEVEKKLTMIFQQRGDVK